MIQRVRPRSAFYPSELTDAGMTSTGGAKADFAMSVRRWTALLSGSRAENDYSDAAMVARNDRNPSTEGAALHQPM